MPDEKPNLLSPAQERQNALSRRDNEGGAGPQGSQKGSTFVDQSEVPPLTNAELVQLRVRVIAVKNLMIMTGKPTDRPGRRPASQARKRSTNAPGAGGARVGAHGGRPACG